jgi:phosphoglycerol transferase MdoB-like AlkP superfamily enzyme
MPAYVSLVCLLVGSIAISTWCSEPAPERWQRTHAWLTEHWPLVFGFWASVVLLELFAVQAEAPVAGWYRLFSLSTCALVVFPIALAPLRVRALVASIVVGLLSLLTFADLLYRHQFGSIIPIELFGRGGDAWEVRRALVSMIRPRHATFLLVGIAGVMAAVLHRRVSFGHVSKRRHWLTVLVCALLAVPGVLLARAHAKSNERWIVIVPRAALGVGVWGAHMIDAWRKLHARSGSIADADVEQMRRDLIARRGTSPTSAPRTLDVLFVQIESLNAWVLDVELEGRPVMPRLRALRERGLFVRLLDQTGNGRSSDADLLALTSQHPLPEAPVSIVRTENRVVALPALFRERGHSTWSFSCDSRDIWQGARRHARYGIQHSSFKHDLGVELEIDCDRPLFQKVKHSLEGAARPFFAWAITLGMHVPYQPLPEGRPRFATGEIAGSMLGNYLDVCHDTDRELGELWTALEASGLAKNLMLVVYGDHSTHEPLVDRGALEQLLPTQLRAEPFWAKRVPLLILAPGLAPFVGAENAGLIDIGPTVLELSAMPVPRVFLGRSLLTNDPTAIAARWDGNVVGRDRTFYDGACWANLWDRRPLEACADMRKTAEHELSLSFRMTRHDLFQRLSQD